MVATVVQKKFTTSRGDKNQHDQSPDDVVYGVSIQGNYQIQPAIMDMCSV